MSVRPCEGCVISSTTLREAANEMASHLVPGMHMRRRSKPGPISIRP
jgi:hypothetical protein